MKNKPLVTGITAVASPVPIVILTVLWAWFRGLIVGVGILGNDTVSGLSSILSMLPLALGPILCTLGIIHGCVKIKCKLAWLGIVLSGIGLMENVLLIFIMYLVGSRL